jgi:hypothetical protein
MQNRQKPGFSGKNYVIKYYNPMALAYNSNYFAAKFTLLKSGYNDI